MKKTKYPAHEVHLESPGHLCTEIMIRFPFECPRPQMLGADDILKYRKKWMRVHSYHPFGIPKKSGGVRQILAPTGNLKYILRVINSILRELWPPVETVHGFTTGRSVSSGAEPHVGAHYVFNTDLQDFFSSIKAPHVFSALAHELGMNKVTAWVISEFCTFPGGGSNDYLPQGSPASPILSNIVCARMDRRLKGLADSFGLTYTRYADDITFSGPYNAFREGEPFRILLDGIIQEEGFSVNAAKTRLQKRGSRQEVTGLTVCEKVNVPRKWVKGLRAQIHRMEKGGCTKEEYRSVRGKVEWIRHVRGPEDPLWRKMASRLRNLEPYLYEVHDFN